MSKMELTEKMKTSLARRYNERFFHIINSEWITIKKHLQVITNIVSVNIVMQLLMI